ncbi:MAG: murein transglycosylase A [Rickettsiales bacterium]
MRSRVSGCGQLAILLLLTACGDATVLKPANYADLQGWDNDAQGEAFTLFVDSCRVLATRKNAYQTREEGAVGERQNWMRACDKAAQMEAPSDTQARAFFEANFKPVKVETEEKPTGLFTGYYEPILHGSRTRQGRFRTPVYGVPRDLRKPYFSRAEIEDGALKNRAKVLLYVDDPIGLFFLQTQGSGKVQLTDGSTIGLQYAAQNGYEYVPIGRILKEQDELEAVSLQTIRDWLLSHPNRMREIMDQNPSYVFFKLSPGDEAAKGAIGLPLTKLRSLAIDDDRAAYGVPTWVETTMTEFARSTQLPLQRLFVSQDTGGALHSPHRGDVFFGRGEVEEWQAGHQNARGNVYWLLPTAPAPAGAEAMPEVP